MTTDSALKTLNIELDYGSREEFSIPRCIINHYSLHKGDGLHCELVELYGHRKRLKSEDPKKIGKEVLIDIEEAPDIKGVFRNIDLDLYEIKNYKYAILDIKEAVKK
jgi:hypothetical protein